MKNKKFIFLITLPFLLSCGKNSDQKELESQIQELNAKIEKIQNSNDSILGNNKKETPIVISNDKIESQKIDNPNADETLNEILIKDLENHNYMDVAKKWSKLYYQIPAKYKNTVYTDSGSFKMDYGDLYGLNKGFSWGLCGKYSESELGNTITDEFGATGGKSKAIEAEGYRAGIVYFYVKYQLLKCAD